MKYLKKFNEEFSQEEFNNWAKAEISKHINLIYSVMKYLKKFNEEFSQEEFNNWAKAEISKHINFNMLKDIKDMSLEQT